MGLDQAFVQCVAFSTKGCIAFLSPHEPGVDIKYAMLQINESGFARIHHRLNRCTWLGYAGLVVIGSRIGLAVYQGMSRGPSPYLAKTSKITPSEVSVAVFEFP